jgi:PPOX class probable F420-dependent enzyme
MSGHRQDTHVRRLGWALSTVSGVTDAHEDDLWDFVRTRRDGILATVDPDGTPQLSNVYFVADASERAVRISTTSRRTKGRNLLRDPHAALHVPGDDFFHFVVLSGEVTCTLAHEVADAGTDELFDVHSSFYEGLERPQFDREMIDEGRMVVRLPATRIYGLLLSDR